jgi:mono/diheme cytochrome c family protein
MAIALALWGAVTLWNDSTAQSSGVGQRLAEAGDMTRRHSAAGADLFAQRCATCHQANGAGVAGAVPPLQGSRFLGANPQLVVQILLHGINGPIAVGETASMGTCRPLAVCSTMARSRVWSRICAPHGGTAERWKQPS